VPFEATSAAIAAAAVAVKKMSQQPVSEQRRGLAAAVPRAGAVGAFGCSRRVRTSERWPAAEGAVAQ
jgi:hypothetical protein